VTFDQRDISAQAAIGPSPSDLPDSCFQATGGTAFEAHFLLNPNRNRIASRIADPVPVDAASPAVA
jgi:hypothetical protein